MQYLIWLAPVIGALVGYLIHHVVVSALLPSRSAEGIISPGPLLQNKDALLLKASNAIAERIPVNELLARVSDPALVQPLLPQIEVAVEGFLKEKLAAEFPMISMFISDKTINKVKTSIMGELETLLPRLLNDYAGNLAASLDLPTLIHTQLSQVNWEEQALGIAESLSKPLSYFKWLGAGVGLLAGLLSVLLHFFAV